MLPATGVNVSQIDRELKEVWDALRASRGQRDEALEEVRITNLRAIDDLRIPFDYPVSVLAGPNGSGKSTVLFACACAYRVPGRRSGHFAPGRLFPNFTSRQEAVRSDPVPETQLEFHYLHDDDRHSMILKRGKSWSRSGFQPEREVYLRTLANLASPSEVRSILQLGRKQVQAEAISPELLIFAHRILPWRYRNLDLISGRSSRDLLFAEIEGADETQYSEFHMSSGERTIVRISKDISGLDNAVVLIDEVDTGMHPYTQRQAMLELQRSALRQKLQIIVASHSPVVLDSVPPEGRIFLDRDQETGKVQRVPLYRDIFQKALYGQSQDRLSILCEDEVAEGVIRGVLETKHRNGFAPRRHSCRQEHRQKRGEEQRDPRISARPKGPNYPLAALLTQTHRSLTDGRLRPPEFRPIRTAHFPSGLHIDSCNMSPEQGIPSNNASRLAT